MGPGRAYRLGGDFKAIIWEDGGGGWQATKGWDHFYGVVDPSRQHVTILIWQLE